MQNSKAFDFRKHLHPRGARLVVRVLSSFLRGLLAAALACIVMSAHARTLTEVLDSGELRICTAGSSAPFYQANAEIFARHLQVRPKVTRLSSWDDQFRNASGAVVMDDSYTAQPLADGSCDLLPNDLHVTSWRSSKMLLVPYYRTQKMVVANHALRQVLRREDDLAEHTAAVQKGTAYAAWLQEQNATRFGGRPIKLVFATTAESMRMVAEGAADFTVIGAESGIRWVRTSPQNLDLLFPVGDSVPVGWGVAPTARDLAEKLADFFADSMRVGSELDGFWLKEYGISLMEFHLFEASIDQAETKRKRLLTWGLPILSCLAGVLLAMGIWMRRQRRELEERRRMEAALSASEEKLRGLYQMSRVGIALTDMQGRFLEFNDAFQNICGYARDELFKLHYWELTPREYAADETRQLASLHEKGYYGPDEKEYVRKDGTRVPLQINGVLIRDSQGTSYIWSLVEDISERKQASLALLDAKQAAEAANRAKSRFLATMSHEIRTPMNGILGMAQLLLMPDLTETERNEYARTILNSGNTLMTLLNDILDLSKVEAGKLELLPGVFDPQQLIDEMAALFAEAAGAKELRFEVRWHGPAHQRYRGDATRLRQMMANLLSNAIKFTAAGQVRLDVAENSRAQNHATLEFAVTDSGIGIPPDRLGALFTPFTQVDGATTREFGGTGLGLSIIKSLARLMGGEVGVSSELGKGSRFWFSAQVETIATEENTRQGERYPATATPAIAGAARCAEIMVVEDNPTNRKVIEALVGKLGLRVSVHENGALALAALKQGLRPALILMDVQMPVMDGLTATRLIRAWETENARQRLPIVALTAGAFEEDHRHCIEVGMDDFLTKPINLALLQSCLDKWLAPASAPPPR
jgi:PAS domain S-box-containing protein